MTQIKKYFLLNVFCFLITSCFSQKLITDEDIYLYHLKRIYGNNVDGLKQETVDRYCINFDLANYRKVNKNEFDYTDYSRRMRNLLIQKISSFNVNQKFYYLSSSKLSEYDFVNKKFYLAKPREREFSLNLELAYVATYKISISFFHNYNYLPNYELKMQENDARNLLQNAAINNRSVTMRIEFNFMNIPSINTDGQAIGYYIYVNKIDIYENSKLTKKLNTISPLLKYYDPVNGKTINNGTIYIPILSNGNQDYKSMSTDSLYVWNKSKEFNSQYQNGMVAYDFVNGYAKGTSRSYNTWGELDWVISLKENCLEPSFKNNIKSCWDGYTYGYAYNLSGKRSVKIVQEYSNGKLNGRFTEYHDNGKIKITCIYKNDSFDGPYLEFDSAGKRISQLYFVDNKLIPALSGYRYKSSFDNKIIDGNYIKALTPIDLVSSFPEEYYDIFNDFSHGGKYKQNGQLKINEAGITVTACNLVNKNGKEIDLNREIVMGMNDLFYLIFYVSGISTSGDIAKISLKTTCMDKNDLVVGLTESLNNDVDLSKRKVFFAFGPEYWSRLKDLPDLNLVYLNFVIQDDTNPKNYFSGYLKIKLKK